MNIIYDSFVNDVNLAICVFPADTLHHDQLKEKMMDYTTFYALRFNQLVNQNNSPIEVYHAENIESGLHDLADKHDHILFMAAGVRILDMSIIFDIKDVINKNDYFVGSHVLDWKDKWYELHHQFVLVNSKKWIAAGSPMYGGWESETSELPVIERSQENFHDDYTPLWIKFTGEFKSQYHQKQGWNFINVASRHGYEIFNWDQTIRSKRTYYYPEDHSDEFIKSLTTLTINGITNSNQKNLISQCNAVSKQIWLLNSENMDLEIDPEKFDTMAYTASGFKFLDAFHSDRLNDNAKIIIYDYNQQSLDWINLIYTSNETNVLELIKIFEGRENFKIFGGKVFSTEGVFTKPFVDSFKITQEYFGGGEKFKQRLNEFRKLKVEFIRVNLFEDGSVLTNSLVGNSMINLSNIFCTDFSNAFFGMSQSNAKLKELISFIKTSCLVLGQDAYCRPIKKRINT